MSSNRDREHTNKGNGKDSNVTTSSSSKSQFVYYNNFFLICQTNASGPSPRNIMIPNDSQIPRNVSVGGPSESVSKAEAEEPWPSLANKLNDVSACVASETLKNSPGYKLWLTRFQKALWPEKFDEKADGTPVWPDASRAALRRWLANVPKEYACIAVNPVFVGFGGVLRLGPAHFLLNHREFGAVKALLDNASVQLKSTWLVKHCEEFGIISDWNAVRRACALDFLANCVKQKRLDFLQLAQANGFQPLQSSRGILSIAVQYLDKSLQIVRFLINSGVPIYSSYFSIALERKNLKLLELLLRHHKLQHAYDISEPLYAACKSDEKLPFVKAFLKYHKKCFIPTKAVILDAAALNNRVNNFDVRRYAPVYDKNATCLTVALENGAFEVAADIIAASRMQLSRRKRIAFLSYDDDAALRSALSHKRLDLAKELLGAGAGKSLLSKELLEDLCADAESQFVWSDFLELMPVVKRAQCVPEQSIIEALAVILTKAHEAAEVNAAKLSRLEFLEAEHSKLHSAYDRLYEAHQACARSKADLTELTQLREANSQLEAKVKQQSAKLLENRKAKTELTKERDELSANLNEALGQAKSVSENLAACQGEQRGLERKLAAMQRKMEALEYEKFQLADKLEKQTELAELTLARNERLVEQNAAASASQRNRKENPNCGICAQEFFVNQRKLTALPCLHFFCAPCVNQLSVSAQWTNQQAPKCPICQKEFIAADAWQLIDSTFT